YYYVFCSLYILFFFFFFFFQAEDGIRDSSVTGVQTCALPISLTGQCTMRGTERSACRLPHNPPTVSHRRATTKHFEKSLFEPLRSEERRVGKECRSRRSAKHKKKKREQKERETDKCSEQIKML